MCPRRSRLWARLNWSHHDSSLNPVPSNRLWDKEGWFVTLEYISPPIQDIKWYSVFSLCPTMDLVMSRLLIRQNLRSHWCTIPRSFRCQGDLKHCSMSQQSDDNSKWSAAPSLHSCGSCTPSCCFYGLLLIWICSKNKKPDYCATCILHSSTIHTWYVKSL